MNAPLSQDRIRAGLKQTGEDAMKEFLRAADNTCLRAALFQLTGDAAIAALPIDRNARAAADRMSPPALEREEDRDRVRTRMAEALGRIRDGSLAVPQPPSLEAFRPLAECFFGEKLNDHAVRFWWEEFGVQPLPRGVDFGGASPEQLRDYGVVVIGGGMSGVTAGVALKAAGIPFTIIERNPELGGTWYRNRYPGARVDVASFSYCNTYEPFYPWQHNFAVRDELQAYFRHHADKHGLWGNVRLNTRATSLRWDDAGKFWNVGVEGPAGAETLNARFVISAIGLFGRPSFPNIEGQASFQGKLMHSAEWDGSYDLAGKRVAVIGTGSSGIQLVGPIAEKVKHLAVFQRTPAWIANMPGYSSPIPDAQRWLSDNVPYYRNWLRLASVFGIGDSYGEALDIDPEWKDPHTINAANKRLRDSLYAYLESKLGHRPDLMARCTPTYPPLAKRLPKDNGWYDAILQDNVELVTDDIERITPRGVATRDGKEREYDLIILATGFKTTEFLLSLDVQGEGGMRLEDYWGADGARAYWGVTIPNFPNLFCMYGPNTNGRAVGPAAWGEMQARYALKCIRNLLKSGKRALNVKQERYDDYNRELDSRMARMIFSRSASDSYFRNEHGRIATNGAFYNREYFQWSYEPDMADYHVS